MCGDGSPDAPACSLKYEKEMLYMGKTLEKILAELQAAVAREEVRLEEARQAEVR